MVFLLNYAALKWTILFYYCHKKVSWNCVMGKLIIFLFIDFSPNYIVSCYHRTYIGTDTPIYKSHMEKVKRTTVG